MHVSADRPLLSDPQLPSDQHTLPLESRYLLIPYRNLTDWMHGTQLPRILWWMWSQGAVIRRRLRGCFNAQVREDYEYTEQEVNKAYKDQAIKWCTSSVPSVAQPNWAERPSTALASSTIPKETMMQYASDAAL